MTTKNLNMIKTKRKQLPNKAMVESLKYFRKRLQQNYSILSGVSAKSEAYVALSTVNAVLDLSIIKLGLFRYLSTVHKIDYYTIRSLTAEVGLKPGVSRSDIIRVASSVLIRDVIRCALYISENVINEIDYIKFGFNRTRDFPKPLLRFLSIIGLRDRYMKIHGSENYVFVKRGKIEIKSEKEFKTFERTIDFFTTLEKITYMFNVINPAMNTQLNIYEYFPLLNSLLSCTFEKNETSYIVKHSDNVPTEKELCETIMFGLNYNIENIPANCLGDFEYEIPMTFNDHISFLFWEEMFGFGINPVSKLETYGGNYIGVSDTILNTPTQIVGSKPSEPVPEQSE